MKRMVSGITLTLLVIGVLTFAPNIQPVRVEGTSAIVTHSSDEPLSGYLDDDILEIHVNGTIHWGSGVVTESEYFNFGTGDIFWSIANQERGYFYGFSFSTPTVFFADKIEGYWGSRDSYQGVQHIWEFMNASDHDWFTQHSITFAEATSPYYTGILLIHQGDLYGAIKPKCIHNGDLDHPEDYVLEYDWWYDDSGDSDFFSLKPHAPDFTLTDIDGADFSLSDYRGKVVLLDFFATWCSPSVAQIPHLKSIHEEFSENLVIISISYAEDEEVLRDFREEHNLEWTIANDTANVFGAYYIQHIPTLVIIDQCGYISYRHAGLTGVEVLRPEIESLLPPKTLLGTGWGWMRIGAKESVYGRAELYKIGEEQIELVIVCEGEEYSRTWNIVWHTEYRCDKRYVCYSEEWGFLIVRLHKHYRWQFWHAFGRGAVAFGFPKHGRLKLVST